MIILALDPGSAQSGVVGFDASTRVVMFHAIAENTRILEYIRAGTYGCDVLVYEAIASYGMPVGREVFDTVLFSGRCIEAWHPKPSHPLERREVKSFLCGSMKAKDANVRAALLDRFGGSAAIGKKASPGPLHGLRAHEFAALAVAVVWADTHCS